MSRYGAEPEITLTFEEARGVYLAVADARDSAAEGSDLRDRLDAVGVLLARKLFPDYPIEGT